MKTFLLVTFWATVGTLPLAMRYFQEVSLIGLIANCLLVPLMGLFVLPVGLLSLFILPVNGYLADVGIQMAGWGLSLALQVLQMLDALEGVAIETFVPSSLEMACYYGLLGIAVMRPAVRPMRWVFLGLLAVLVADGLYWGYERFWHRDLRVTVIDVGQGSAALVAFPGGKTMLIDGGGYTNNRFFDVGERIIAPFLRYRKIMQIDTIVLSHPSSDHMNGLVYILAHFNPKKLLWTGDRAPTESFRLFIQEVVRSGVQVPEFFQMERQMNINDVRVELLYPPAGSISNDHNRSGAEYNNHSIVLKLTMGACGILFPGDVETRAEEELVACCRAALSSRCLSWHRIMAVGPPARWIFWRRSTRTLSSFPLAGRIVSDFPMQALSNGINLWRPRSTERMTVAPLVFEPMVVNGWLIRSKPEGLHESVCEPVILSYRR